jgi:glycosyltransferase involved in cell wall biosynthesis
VQNARRDDIDSVVINEARARARSRPAARPHRGRCGVHELVNVGFALLTLFPGRAGGSETYARGLLSEYAKGDGPEHVTVLANRHVMAAYRDTVRGPVRLHHVASYRPGDSMLTRSMAVASARLFPRVVGRDAPRVDLVHYPVTVPIPDLDRPMVVALHDVQHHEHPDFFSRAERAWRRWAYDGAARRAGLVVTISEHSRGQIVERLGIPPSRVVTIPLGVEHERYSPRRSEADAALEVPERFLLYPANLWPHKNHARLLRAFAAVGDIELHLLLVGQTYGRALPGPTDARVRHLGYVDHDVLASLYRRATAVIFPSLIEGFGLPLLEAMASGCPVAASDEGAIAEVCGDAALLFDPRSEDSMADAMRRLATDPRLAIRLRDEGLRRASLFTWRACATAHVEAYRALLERSR